MKKLTYVMTDGLSFKIGESVDPEKRAKLLVGGNINIRLLFYGDGITEKKAHDLFTSKRCRLEWFSLSEDDLLDLKNKLSSKKVFRDFTIEDEFDLSSIGFEVNEYKPITYKDELVISQSAFLYLQKLLNNTYVGRVLVMANTVRTKHSILYNNNVPHTNKTLQELLGMKSESGYFRFVKKLLSINVIHQEKASVYGRILVVYRFNPYIARKLSVFDNKVFEIFTEFKEK